MFLNLAPGHTRRLAFGFATAYVSPMSLRALRRIVFALVTVQLLLAAPVASALVETAAAEMAIPSHDPHAPDSVEESNSCPCCPTDVMATSAAVCQSACAASIAVFPGTSFLLSSPVAVPALAATTVLYSPLADPPLNPPPIA